MTLEEYIRNPKGSGAASMSNRQLYYEMYSDKWDKLKLRENGLINYTLYQGKEDYYIHFKIPDELIPKFYYDTVIRFYLSDKMTGVIPKSLSQYDVQFYSNDPSFVFTFAHAFKKNKLFIKDLEPRMSARALKDKAVIRNPKDEIGYVKSLFFSYLEIKHADLMNKQRWEVKAKPYSKGVWTTAVRHADDVIDERQEKGREIAKQQRQEKKTQQQYQNTRSSVNTRKSKLDSPNQPDFGKFKKTDFNTIVSKAKSEKKSIGKFTKTIK